MTLKTTIDLITFDADLQRFADTFGDSIETEDINELVKRFWGILPLKTLKAVNTADSVGDAFDFVDILTQETRDQALFKLRVLQGKTVHGLEVLANCQYSINKGWFNDWEEFEEDLINLMPNQALKNYIPLGSPEDTETERAKIYRVRERLAETVGDLLFEDIQDLSCDIVERGEVIKGFAEEYEPNFKESEYFEAFESGFRCQTWGELFQYFAEWVNTLVYVSYDANGETVEGETVGRDYLYLLGGLLAWA